MDCNDYKPMPAKSMENVQHTAIIRLLRDRESQEYWADGSWTQNPSEAKSFSDALEAAEACTSRGLSNVELAVRFESSETDVFCTPMR